MVFVNVSETVEKHTGLHTLLAAELYYVELQPVVGRGHKQTAAIYIQCARLLSMASLGSLGGSEHLEHRRLAFGRHHVGPCTGIGR